MTIEYELTKKDLVAFQMYHMYHSQRTRSGMYIAAFGSMILITSILVRLFPGILYGYASLSEWQRVLVIVTGLPASFFLFRELMRLLCNMGIEREKKKNPNHPLGMRQILFDRDGMQVNFRSYESSFAWRGLYKIVKRKEYYYIYTNSETAHIIPKRIFADKAHDEEFSRILSEIANLTKKKG